MIGKICFATMSLGHEVSQSKKATINFVILGVLVSLW